MLRLIIQNEEVNIHMDAPIPWLKISSVDVHDHSEFPDKSLNRCRVPSGTPLFFSGDLKPITVVNCFLLSVRRSTKGKRGNSEKSYGDDIAQFLTFLDAQKLQLRHIRKDDLIEFAGCLLDGISVKTSRAFAPTTVARRVRTAIALCQFGFREGLLQSDAELGEGTAEEILSIALSEKEVLDATLQNALSPPETVGRKIHPIPLKFISRIFDALGPLDWAEPGDQPQRNRLAAELSLATGMRIDEICAVSTYQIIDLQLKADVNDPWQVLPLWLTETKGSVPREVLVPQKLVLRLINYIDHERQLVVDRALSLGKFKQQGSQPTKLFLNGLNCNHRDIGEPCNPETLSRAFTDAVIRLGFTTRQEIFVLNDEGRPLKDTANGKWLMEIIFVPSHTFHDLRHTYAVENYQIAKKKGEKDPVRRIQNLLGHALRQTTESIYLPWLNGREQDYSDQYADLLMSIDGWSRS